MDTLTGSLAAKGTPAEKAVWQELISATNGQHGLLGYRLPSVGERDSARVPSFVLISDMYGIVLVEILDEVVEGISIDGDYFISSKGDQIPRSDFKVDDFLLRIKDRLREDRVLFDRRTRDIRIRIKKVVFLVDTTRPQEGTLTRFNDLFTDFTIFRDEKISSVLAEIANGHPPYEAGIVDRTIAGLEGTTTLIRKTNLPATLEPKTRNDFLQLSLDFTFKLDNVQRQVALQIPAGPQRIRGLAGTGKTVILSLKAALAHKDFTNFSILFLFNTQSMYPQIRDRISQYYVRETGETPDWSRVRVLHAWGGRDQEGLYSHLCRQIGLERMTYSDVKSQSNALEYIYSDILRKARTRLEAQFDLILIDEAQDFPPSLFEVVYHIARNPKRIVWAYDEFQSLTDLRMPEPSELFGKRADGAPNVPDDAISGSDAGGVARDFVLPNSYRNPRITLMTAHGVALGLKREGGVIDIMEQRRDWEALGYKVVKPLAKYKFEPGDDIELERPTEYSKNILEELLRKSGQNEKNLLTFFDPFSSKEQEFDSVSDEVDSLIKAEGVSPEEIIVVTLDPLRARHELSMLRRKLDEKGIKSIMPGFVEKPAVFQEKGFVTLATPFRAKGNEANIVFVVSAELVVADLTFRMRNAAFVALTRSRGWTYVAGYGQNTSLLRDEIRRVLADYPRVSFQFPRAADLERRRQILKADDAKLQQIGEALNEVTAYPEILLEALKSRPDLREMVKRELEEDL